MKKAVYLAIVCFLAVSCLTACNGCKKQAEEVPSSEDIISEDEGIYPVEEEIIEEDDFGGSLEEDYEDEESYPVTHYKECPLCYGLGKCGVCGGSGMVYSVFYGNEVGEGRFTDCGGCGGSGRCPSCEGSGYVEDFMWID